MQNEALNDETTTVAILGAGMLGGSLALALQKAEGDFRPILWGRRKAFADEALSTGIKEPVAELADAVKSAHIIVLATPIGAMAEVLKSALVHVQHSVLVTDMGSTKVLPDQSLRAVLENSEHRFIGSHPMAGSEQVGVMSGKADLFEGAVIITTPSEQDDSKDINLLERLWQTVGGSVVTMSPESHDATVARVSHYPHAMASICAKVALADERMKAFVGGGLRDTSRVAGGNPAMWAEILLENREAVTDSLNESLSVTEELLAYLQTNDREGLETFLADAKSLRDTLGYR